MAKRERRRANAGDRPDRLRLRPAGSLRAALAESLGSIVGYALASARRAARDPEGAVHEWRKSLRRARALLRLLREVLPRAELDAAVDVFRSAQRAASRLRDADVLGPILVELAAHPAATVTVRREMAARARRLGAISRKRSNRAAALATLRPHVARLAAVLRRLLRVLPDDLDWSDIQRALAGSFRRVARRHRRAKHHEVDQRFHDLRKAVKTLHYQVEWLASAGDARSERLRGRLAALAEAQGQVTDLLLVRAAVTHQDGDDPPRLTPSRRALEDFLSRAIRLRRVPAERAAARLLDRSAHTLARRLVQTAKERIAIGNE